MRDDAIRGTLAEDILNAELARLRAENAAMREIVQAVAAYEWQTASCGFDNVSVPCPFCYVSPQAYEDNAGLQHEADCPVTKSRAIPGKD